MATFGTIDWFKEMCSKSSCSNRFIPIRIASNHTETIAPYDVRSFIKYNKNVLLISLHAYANGDIPALEPLFILSSTSFSVEHPILATDRKFTYIDELDVIRVLYIKSFGDQYVIVSPTLIPMGRQIEATCAIPLPDEPDTNLVTLPPDDYYT